MESSHRSLALPVLATSIAIAASLLLLFPPGREPDGHAADAAAALEAGGQADPHVTGTAPPTATGDPCDFDLPRAFWSYVEFALGADDPALRSAEVGRPAREVREMAAAELRAIGVLDAAGLSLESRHGGAPLAALLRDSLMEHWLACADRKGGREALRAAALELLGRACAPGLVRADPAALELACALAGRFTSEDDVRRLLSVLLPALEDVREEPALASERARPLLDLAASFARFPWARDELLTLLGASWMDGQRRGSFRLALLTARPGFGDWRAALERGLREGTGAKRRAALEVLEDIATRRGADGRAQLAAEHLVAAIPAELLCASDAALSRAALELLARHGGEPGRRALVALLDDPACPRATILALLEGVPTGERER